MSERVPRCAMCGGFVGEIVARVEGIGEPEVIAAVMGRCRTHGRVEAVIEPGWSWEDFFPEDAA